MVVDRSYSLLISEVGLISEQNVQRRPMRRTERFRSGRRMIIRLSKSSMRNTMERQAAIRRIMISIRITRNGKIINFAEQLCRF